jgi:outer membrane protein assembly factor BamA
MRGRSICTRPRTRDGRAASRRAAAAALAVLLLPGPPGAARAAAELEYAGRVLPVREVRALAREALTAPGDTAQRARMLGALVARLEAHGHLDARATARHEAGAGRLVVTVTEGPRYALRSVRIDVPGGADSALFAGALPLAPGAPASPPAIESAVRAAVRAAVDAGHAYARLGVTGWRTDEDAVDLVLSGAAGPAVTVTGVRIDGLAVTRREVALRAMGALEGGRYDPRTAAAARDRLEQLGLFARVEWAGLRGERDWSRAHLIYRVEEPRYNQFDGVVGVQGEAGTVGSARLDLGNLLGTGRQVGLAWQSRGRGLTDLAARYVEPLVLGLPLSLRLGLEQQVQDTFYVRTRWGARAGYALSGQERIEAGYEQERAVQERGEVEEAQMQYTVFGFERSALDRRIGARRGTRVRAEAAGIFKRERLRPDGSRKANASAVTLEGEWHRPLGAASGATLEWRAAARFSSERVLPLYERYPLGGAASLRGFDEESFRVDRYALGRLEWRWFFGEGAPRAFAFWDHAWMAARETVAEGGDRLETRHADALGVGLRIEAAGGIVGIDYGLEAGRTPLDGKIHLRLVSTF